MRDIICCGQRSFSVLLSSNEMIPIGSTLIFTFQTSKILPSDDTLFTPFRSQFKRVATFYFIVAGSAKQKNASEIFVHLNFEAIYQAPSTMTTDFK